MMEAKAAELDAEIGAALGIAMSRYPEAAMQVIARRLGSRGLDLLAEEYSLGFAGYDDELDESIDCDEEDSDEPEPF